MSQEPAEAERCRGVVVGTFDLLHPGHLETLRAARDRADELVVLVRDDRWVERLHGPGWPVNGGADRVGVLEALRWVDRARLVAESELGDVLELLRPDFVVDEEEQAAGPTHRSRTDAILERAGAGD